MAIASTLTDFLHEQDVPYNMMVHAPSQWAQETAEYSAVPGDRVAKGILLHDEHGPLVAVIPATRRLEPELLGRLLDRAVTLAPEGDLADLFPDCVPGAVPAVAQAWGLRVVWDDALADIPEVHIEGGDHENLLVLGGADFRHLMRDAPHGTVSRHV